MASEKGVVFDIYRGTSHDGPGLRTTVFFKGCPLRCKWCQNPEGLEASPELLHDSRKCIGCLACLKACQNDAISSGAMGLAIDKSKCRSCGACVKACPAQAMTFSGRAWTCDELVKEVLKDKAYYEQFSGGVTASGGEPLLQYEFLVSFFRELKLQGVSTALDTCGFATPSAFNAVLEWTDCLLFDIKLFESRRHKEFAGQPNEQIFENLLNAAALIKGGLPLRLWIRTPLIPDATATEDNIEAIARFIKTRVGDALERWELCAFNSSCNFKYSKIGKSWIYKNSSMINSSQINSMKKAAFSSGLPESKLVISGIVKEN